MERAMDYMQGIAKVFQPSYWYDQSSISIINDDQLILYNHDSMGWVLIPIDPSLMLRIVDVMRVRSPNGVQVDDLTIQYINGGQHYEEGFMMRVGQVSAFLEEKDINAFTALMEALSNGVSSL
jgi:hypothetical protein